MLAAGLHPGPTGAERYPHPAEINIPPRPERLAPHPGTITPEEYEAPIFMESDTSAPIPPQPIQVSPTDHFDRARRERQARRAGKATSPQRPTLPRSGGQPIDQPPSRAWRDTLRSSPNWERFERLRTHRPPPSNADRPSQLANNPGPPANDNLALGQSRTATDVEKGIPSETYRHPWVMGDVRWDDLTWAEKTEILRLPWTSKSACKGHVVCGMGELVGTTLFLFFAFAGTEVANIQASNAGSDTTTGNDNGFNISVLFYISVAFGFSLIVNVWVFFRISGGLFNPAVTFTMLVIKAIDPIRAIVLFIAQMLGGILASVIVRFLFPEAFNVRTTLGGGTSLAQGVFIEAILTAELIFTILMLAWEKHRATFIAPVGIGLALFIAEMAGVYFTGGSLNPARSFGPCVVTANFDQEHWIYWVGPLLGSLIAVGFYKFIKLLEYELVNPGADADHPPRHPNPAWTRASSEPTTVSPALRTLA